VTTPRTRHPPAAAAAPSGPPAQAQRPAYRRRKTRARIKSAALGQREAARAEALPVQHPHAAGIGIGSRSHWVCVGFATDAASCLIREFPAHTAGLQASVAFLREHRVTRVALESDVLAPPETLQFQRPTMAWYADRPPGRYHNRPFLLPFSPRPF
jgi:hypothetical protein